MSSRKLDELARRFASLELSREAWTHEAHLLVGLWHVSRYGHEVALQRLREGIRKLNVSNGVANTTSGGYHETITRAYVTLLAQFDDGGQALRLAERAARLLEHPLADRNALFAFYSRERLLSPAARVEWLDPDLAPLEIVRLAREAPAL